MASPPLHAASESVWASAWDIGQPIGTPALPAMQEVNGALRVGGGAEDRPLVALQDLEPAGDIGGVIVPGLDLEPKIGGKEGRAELRCQLLPRIALIAIPLAPLIAVKP